jgi:hypothetical protein
VPLPGKANNYSPELVSLYSQLFLQFAMTPEDYATRYDLPFVPHRGGVADGGHAFTASGATAGRIARKRPRVPILATTTSVEVSHRLCLCGAQTERAF